MHRAPLPQHAKALMLQPMHPAYTACLYWTLESTAHSVYYMHSTGPSRLLIDACPIQSSFNHHKLGHQCTARHCQT
jgi:hypothetical protein